MAADEAPKFGNALDWVPADAAMFSSSLRLKEQVEIVANSKAWAKLKEIPVVQQGILGAQLYYGMMATELNQTIQKPENQQLIDLVRRSVLARDRLVRRSADGRSRSAWPRMFTTPRSTIRRPSIPRTPAIRSRTTRKPPHAARSSDYRAISTS